VLEEFFLVILISNIQITYYYSALYGCVQDALFVYR